MTLPMMLRDYAWKPASGPGIERLQLQAFDHSWQVDSSLMGELEGQDFSGSYWMRLDEHWTTLQLRLRLQLETPAPEGKHQHAALELQHDGRGHWLLDGQHQPDLDGCLNVDLAITPFTNSPPVLRYHWRQGESHDFDMVFVTATLDPDSGDLAILTRRQRQRYSCLDPLGSSEDGGGRFRYQGLDSGFDAALVFDAQGVVVDYPDTFVRIDPQ
jgi:hypothetical protein|tara:strand:+ start:3405 stop:4046 length:642 start_codon:yes stop_codon:yes gene_type:complete